METLLQKIFSQIRNVRLTEGERIAMRNTLLSVMREHPQVFPESTAPRISIFRFVSLHTGGVLSAAFALVLTVGLGTSYAAQNALPGDPLYALKVRVNEPVQGVLALTPVEQAQWNASLVSRRLEEAASLAAKDTLSDTSRSELEMQLARNTDKFEKSVAVLRDAPEGVVAVAAVQSEHEAVLLGHERVLTTLSETLPSEAPALEPILKKVREKTALARTSRMSSERAVENSAPAVRTVALEQKKQVRDRVKKLREHGADARTNAAPVAAKMTMTMAASMDATTTEATSTPTVDEVLDQADARLEQGDYKDALSSYQEILRATQTEEVNLEAQTRLHNDLQIRSESNSGPSQEDDKVQELRSQ